MKIATWNINGLQARFDFMLHWLRSRQPDIVGLQELKLAEEKFPFLALESEGYHSVVHSQKAWNGVAILSRAPIEPTVKGLAGEEEFGARLISARTMDLEFCTVYVPNGKRVDHRDFPRKLAWLEALDHHLAAQDVSSRPFILCGDFNICPAALDSWNEEELAGRIFHTEQERSRLQGILDKGLIDTFRHLYPEQQTFSWWDYRAGAFHRNRGLRIDLLLASRPIVERLEAASTDRDYRKKKDGMIASDHAPVIAEIRDV